MPLSISRGPEAAFGTPLPSRSLRGQGFKSPPEAPRQPSLPLEGAAPGSQEPRLRLRTPTPTPPQGFGWMEDGDSLSSIFRSRGPRLSAHRAPPTSQHLKSHPLRSLPPARTQASGLLASEGGGRQGCQRLRKRLGASGSLFHSDPRPPRPRFSVLPRSQRKQLGQINGKLLRAGPRYSAPPPPGLRAGPQPPPRGVSDPRDLPRAAPPPSAPHGGGAEPGPGGGGGSRGQPRAGGPYLGRKYRRE